MKLSPELERGRVRTGPYGSNPGEDFGAFFIDGPCGRQLKIIASSGDTSVGIDWEHVSVSLDNRCPNWPEMCFVKPIGAQRLFPQTKATPLSRLTATLRGSIWRE
jgi:hypothetical protein